MFIQRVTSFKQYHCLQVIAMYWIFFNLMIYLFSSYIYVGEIAIEKRCVYSNVNIFGKSRGLIINKYIVCTICHIKVFYSDRKQKRGKCRKWNFEFFGKYLSKKNTTYNVLKKKQFLNSNPCKNDFVSEKI